MNRALGSYKALIAIIDAIEFRIAFYIDQVKYEPDENMQSDIQNDIAFLESLLEELRTDLNSLLSQNGKR